MMMDHHHFAGALAAAEKAVEVGPASYPAYRLKGLAETELGRFADAENSFAQALELSPSDREAIRNLATAQWSEGKIQAAESTFRKGIQQFPQDARFCQDYGAMLLESATVGDVATESRGVSLLRKAIELDSSLSDPHFELGKLALRKRRTQEALRHFKTAGEFDPSSSKIHYSLARVYRLLVRGGASAQEGQLYKSLRTEEGRHSTNPSSRRWMYTQPANQT